MNLNKIEGKKFLGKGNYGKCYELESGSILKLFNKPQSLIEIDKFRYMLKYKNESFLFPFDFVYDDKKFYGYISKKSLGIPLKDSFSSSNIEELSNNSILLEEDILKISEGRILIDDFHEGKIMYDGQKLEVIDTDFYQALVPFTPKEIRKDNLFHYKIVLARLFKTNITYIEDTKYIFGQIDKYLHSDILPSDMIASIKEDMEKYYKEKIKTMNQIQKIIRR